MAQIRQENQTTHQHFDALKNQLQDSETSLLAKTSELTSLKETLIQRDGRVTQLEQEQRTVSL